jgi:rare lipoprotein A
MRQFKLILLSALTLINWCYAQPYKHKLKGTASYYHNKFNNRKTSSGETFHNINYTAAHKTMPLGTWVIVTRLSNRLYVIVKVNDRLPPDSKRTIDLSQAAARKLKMIQRGLAKVKIEVIPRYSIKMIMPISNN